MLSCKYWNNKDRTYLVQTNNGIETLVPGLEYCGPTAATICIFGKYDIPVIDMPGGWVPQPEDLSTLYFIDQSNWPKFKIIRMLDLNAIPPNRVPQYYPAMSKEVWGKESTFKWDMTWENLRDEFTKGNSIQICFKNPAHYCAALAFDVDTNEIIYNDPWPAHCPGGNGFNIRLTKSEFDRNVNNFFIVY
jgi:hypothetical protein